MRDIKICKKCKLFHINDNFYMKCRFEGIKTKNIGIYKNRLVSDRCPYYLEHLISTQNNQIIRID